jgi:hypothetical protein
MPPDVAVPTAPALARLDRVELAHAGTWNIALGGTQTFTPDDFAAAVAALDCPAVRRPVVKLGHFDDRTTGYTDLNAQGNRDGEPALGWVTNMGLASNRNTLIADLVGMPGWLGQIAASAYPDRSIEGCRNYRCQIGHLHPFVISAVALLGVTPPGVATLGSLQDHVRAMYGVAASTDQAIGGEPFTVTFPATKEAPVPNPRPELVAAAVTVDELRAAFHSQSPWDYWIVEVQLNPLQLIVTSDGNGETYRVPVTVGADGDSFTFGQPVAVEVTYVDETVPEPVAAAAKPLSIVFASRQQSRPGPRVAASAATTWPTPAEPATPAAPPASAPAAAAPPAPPQPPEPAPAAPVVPAAEPAPTTEPEGGTNVSLSEFRSRLGLDETADEAAVLAALDERLTPKPDPQLVAAAAQQEQQFAAALGRIDTLSTELAQIKAEKAADAKAAFFAAAISQGKIAPADRPTWEADYDKSPEVVTRILGAIKPGTAVPVAAAGYVGNPEPMATDEDLMALFSPESRAALAAQKGA